MTFRLALLISGCAAAALAGSDKMAKDLNTAPPGSNVAVIVQYTRAPGQADFDRLTGNGGWSVRALPSVNGSRGPPSGGAFGRPGRLPEVAYITPDRPVRRSMDHTSPAVGADIALSYGYTGKGVTVAVIDSGIADHADLRDPVDRQIASGLPRILCPAAGEGPVRPRNARGRNPGGHRQRLRRRAARHRSSGACWWTCRRSMRTASGTDSSVVRALERAIELKERFGIRVVNLSLGRPVVESYTAGPDLPRGRKRRGKPGWWWSWRPATRAAPVSRAATDTGPSPRRATIRTCSRSAPCGPWGRPDAETIWSPATAPRGRLCSTAW